MSDAPVNSGGYPMTPGNSLTGPDPLVGSPLYPTHEQVVQKLNALTPPEEMEIVPVRHYICTMPNSSMYRKDGTRIIFTGGMFETNLKATQVYLDTEIGLGNSFLRMATQPEIDEYNMRKDPRGTIKEQVRAEIEGEMRAKLEAEILERLKLLSAAEIPGQQEVDNSNKAAEGIAGTDVADFLSKARKVLRTDNATITMPNTGPQLQGIVSTADLGGGAAGSASTSGNSVPTGNSGF